MCPLNDVGLVTKNGTEGWRMWGGARMGESGGDSRSGVAVQGMGTDERTRRVLRFTAGTNDAQEGVCAIDA